MQSKFGRFDVLLFLLAIAGFAGFYLFFPGQHPDAVADFSLGQAEAVDRTRSFLIENNYSSAGLDHSVRFYRDPNRMQSMQTHFGRSNLVRLLKNDTSSIDPAYYWQIQFRTADENKETRFDVDLSEKGKVRRFISHHENARGVNRRALSAAARVVPDPSETNDAATPATVSDSLLIASLSFIEQDSLWNRPARVDADTSDNTLLSVWQAIRRGNAPLRILLGPREAASIARYHLSQSALGSYPLKVDSMWIVREGNGKSRARIRFASDSSVYGQKLNAEIEITPTGVLRELASYYQDKTASSQASERGIVRNDPDPGRGPGHREPRGGSAQASVNVSEAADILEIVIFLVLLFTFLFLFFRQLNARLIDPRLSIRDGFLAGLFLGCMIILEAAPEIIRSTNNIWMGVALAGVGGVIVGGGGAFLVFFLSSVGDSLSREVWPDKLVTLNLVRHGALRNQPVGFSLVRGFALSGVIMGLVTLLLVFLPGMELDFKGESNFLNTGAISPIGYYLGVNVWYGLFSGFLLLLGVGTLIYKKVKRPDLLIAILTLLFCFVRIGPIDVQPIGYEYALAGTVGLVISIAFWKYDFITCFIGFILMKILVATAPGWMAQDAPTIVDAMAGVGLASVVLIFGFVGIASKRSSSELPVYVPTYVQELASQERMKRELELARHVQETFLPRSMPRMEGLDLAAMCLAAQEIGGDYYDFVQLGPDQLAVVVGDVSGKGIQAAFYMTLVKGFVQTLSRTVLSPTEVLQKLNTLFCENAPRGTFISLIYGIIDVQARTFTFARAGHNPIILKRSPSQESEFVQPAGMAIGLISGPRFDASIEQAVIHLRPGDVLVFYTDGFSEAMNSAREQYGDHRLAQKVSGFGQRSAAEILRSVSEDVHHFVEATGRHDDMTMVVAKLVRPEAHVVSMASRNEQPAPVSISLQ